jgi:hypothetical protein
MTATDPFGAPVSEFVKLEDILGRLVLITPNTIIKGIASTLKGQEGKTYDAVRAQVVVLDGPVSEKIEAVPTALEDFRLSGASIVPAVMARFKATGATVGGGQGEYDVAPKDPAVPYVLGRVAQVKSSYGTPSWVLNPFDPEDAELARTYLASAPKPADPFAG